MTGRSGEDGGSLETGAKTCRMFAGASPLLAAGLAVLRCPGLPRAETLRPSVSVGCAATGVRFGRFRWDDRAAAISVIRVRRPHRRPIKPTRTAWCRPYCPADAGCGMVRLRRGSGRPGQRPPCP
ncbi:hypothetical protein CHELA41_23070 [Hyphomicrobiales bacterium]|nr:hypothetical protein CHELA41_23070 [Hyphomicrobiales bacterium]